MIGEIASPVAPDRHERVASLTRRIVDAGQCVLDELTRGYGAGAKFFGQLGDRFHGQGFDSPQ
jgi:hypothetical protein